jgi:uracil-DNA glycosylase
MIASPEPSSDCPFCPRLVDFRTSWRAREPEWHNAPVETWHDPAGRNAVNLLIVGLAPGLRGANRTGRPFTGDYAGDLLYATLAEYGFAAGSYGAVPDDSLQLKGTAITNAVRCVPPENKPTAAEINACRQFLSATIESFPNLRAIVTLGKIAHDSTLRALGVRIASAPFRHGGAHEIRTQQAKLHLLSSYHCSRYNTNTGRLTEAMFQSVFEHAARLLDINRRKSASP